MQQRWYIIFIFFRLFLSSILSDTYDLSFIPLPFLFLFSVNKIKMVRSDWRGEVSSGMFHCEFSIKIQWKRRRDFTRWRTDGLSFLLQNYFLNFLLLWYKHIVITIIMIIIMMIIIITITIVIITIIIVIRCVSNIRSIGTNTITKTSRNIPHTHRRTFFGRRFRHPKSLSHFVLYGPYEFFMGMFFVSFWFQGRMFFFLTYSCFFAWNSYFMRF